MTKHATIRSLVLTFASRENEGALEGFHSPISGSVDTFLLLPRKEGRELHSFGKLKIKEK